ncbi:MAG TPA: glycosyltransferase [Thermodesulfobacteriota bacterium]
MTRRIGLISEHASPVGLLGGVDAGGQNVYVAELATHLAALGYEVDVFTRRDSARLPERVALGPRLRLVHVPAGPAAPVPKESLLPYMDAFGAYVRHAARRRRYDLFHANFFMSGLVAADLKAALGVPFVVTFHALGRVRRLHQQGADGFPDARFAIEERVIAEADRVLAECPQDAEDLRRFYDADPSRLVMIPCGVAPETFYPVPRRFARRVTGLPARGTILLQLGRMVPRKGVDIVIRALARLRERHGVRATLVVVGGDGDTPDPAVTPEIGRLAAVAREADVADGVVFTGRRPVESLRFYYSAADVFITTPWYEPFGITPLEAMACARPVVGAAVGGIAYTVVDGETGFLVPPCDPDAVADRVARICAAPQLGRAMGRRGLARVRAHFTWREVSARVAALYESVLAARGADARPRAVGAPEPEAALPAAADAPPVAMNP